MKLGLIEICVTGLLVYCAALVFDARTEPVYLFISLFVIIILVKVVAKRIAGK